MRNQYSQGVVVAEPDFFNSYRVILIDHGNDSKMKELQKSAMSIGIAPSIRQIVPGQKYLCHSQPKAAKCRVVGMHQIALPNGGQSLKLGHILGALCKAQLKHPGRDGAGSHYDAADPPFLKDFDLSCQTFQKSISDFHAAGVR